jgi:hypothetical protein
MDALPAGERSVLRTTGEHGEEEDVRHGGATIEAARLGIRSSHFPAVRWRQ